MFSDVKAGLHNHHVVPSAYGGANGPLVTLAGSTHTLIHSLANSIYSEVKSSLPSLSYRRNSLTYMVGTLCSQYHQALSNYTPVQQQRIVYLVWVIVYSRSISEAQNHRKTTKMQLELSAELNQKVEIIAKSFGLPSKVATVEQCIELVYKSKYMKGASC